MRHKIAHLKSIFGGGSKVSDDEPDQAVVRSSELLGTINGTNEGVEAEALAVKELQGFGAATIGVAVNHEENTLESDLAESDEGGLSASPIPNPKFLAAKSESYKELRLNGLGNAMRELASNHIGHLAKD